MFRSELKTLNNISIPRWNYSCNQTIKIQFTVSAMHLKQHMQLWFTAVFKIKMVQYTWQCWQPEQEWPNQCYVYSKIRVNRSSIINTISSKKQKKKTLALTEVTEIHSCKDILGWKYHQIQQIVNPEAWIQRHCNNFECPEFLTNSKLELIYKNTGSDIISQVFLAALSRYMYVLLRIEEIV